MAVLKLQKKYLVFTGQLHASQRVKALQFKVSKIRHRIESQPSLRRQSVNNDPHSLGYWVTILEMSVAGVCTHPSGTHFKVWYSFFLYR